MRKQTLDLSVQLRLNYYRFGGHRTNIRNMWCLRATNYYSASIFFRGDNKTKYSIATAFAGIPALVLLFSVPQIVSERLKYRQTGQMLRKVPVNPKNHPE